VKAQIQVKSMRLLLIVMLVALHGSALAQQEAFDAAKAMTEQLRPYRECLKTEIAKASSKEEARQIVQEACFELRNSLRPGLIATVKRIWTPMPTSVSPDAFADAALRMSQTSVYFEFTGEERAIQQEQKRRAGERLKSR